LATNVLASLGVTGHAKTLLESVLSLAYACSSIRGTSTQKYLVKDKVCDVITMMGHLLGKAYATRATYQLSDKLHTGLHLRYDLQRL
jgi:hypothetical protein